jgi:hypothetical protein
MDSKLATKADIVRLDAALERLDAKFDAKFDKAHWMLGAVIALVTAILIKQFF